MELSDLRYVIESEELAPPRIRLLAGGRYNDPRTMKAFRDGRLILATEYERVAKAVETDSTLVIDNVTLLNSYIHELCGEVEALIGRSCSANLYCAKMPESGFGAHSDQHDVLVVQLAGRKRWQIESPFSDLRDFELNTGDVLYVPEGIVHDVKSTGVLSIHLSISVS